MNILLETDELVIAEKEVGMLSEESAEPNIVSALKEELGCEIFPVHRLDRAVGGVIAFAKTKSAASALSLPGALKKEYIAVVHGKTEPEGEMRDLLFKDSRTNKSYVVKRVRRGVKEASLTYKTLGYAEDLSLVSVNLETGRSHQIRVQFSSRRHPLVGDGKYGASDGCPVGLYCRSVTAMLGGREYTASSLPGRVYPWNLFESLFDAE
ncbi:MAG: RNA pseudouridine synthase [Clostridia bacterium]|nr:RNA pseudouridine synthase [Clostridia bacterium]